MSTEKKPNQQISIRLPRLMYQELRAAAKRERRSMNAQILKILEEEASKQVTTA